MIADRSRSRGPAYRWLTFALVIGLCLLPGPARFSAQEKQEEGGDKKEKKDLPLEPDRTIDFETSEGSWISLDVAPDGRAIVFELIGDLYTLPISGGAATRIASGLNFDSQPRYSPDGSKIVFLSDRSGDENVWIANHDGTDPRPLTKGKSTRYWSPEWTPDGKYIVVSRSGTATTGTQLWLYHVDGGNGVNLTGSEERRQLNPMGAAFGKDDRFVYYTERTAAGSVYNQMNFRWQLGVYDRQTGENFRMSDELGSAMRPVLSPDGRWLVYATRWDGTDRKTHVKVTGYKNPNAEQAGPASDVMMGPDGETAIAEAQHHVYLITVPVKGGEAPTVALASPDSASVPVRKLTTVGGEFLSWAEGGKIVTFALGRTLFRYDLDASKAAYDAEKRKAEQEKAKTPGEAAGPDKPAGEQKPPERKKPAYEATAVEVIVEAARAKAVGTVLLRGARILTMNGTEAIENGDILIKDNRIEEVGRRGQVKAPAGVKTIDVTGKTIMPGLIDVHAHIWPAWGIHKTQVWEYLANLAYGVTTTRDPQTATTDVLSYRDMVETGQMIGPRVYGTGPGVFSQDNVQSLDEARDVLKRYSQYWDTKTIKQYMAGNRQQRQWIIMAAKEQKLMPTLEGGLDLKLNLTQILDGYAGLEHTLPIMPLYKDVIQLVAQSGIVYTPTLLVQYGGPWAENYFYESTDVHGDTKMRRFTPHSDLDGSVLRRPWFHEQEYSFPLAAKVLADVVAAGGKIGLGGHGQRQGIQCHWELWAIASGGMSNQDVLKVGTIFGAEAIGMAKDLGTIEKGKLADLIVLDRNPLENIRNTNSVRYVMKNGEIYDAETLDQIWPQQKKLPRQYWWDLEPTLRKTAPNRPSITTNGGSAK